MKPLKLIGIVLGLIGAILYLTTGKDNPVLLFYMWGFNFLLFAR